MLDPYGSLALKHWASKDEERKGFIFLKIPESLREIENAGVLRPILDNLYNKHAEKVPKKVYRTRKIQKPKEYRKVGAGRKIRNVELEKHILQRLEEGIETLDYPTRKLTIMYAKKWKQLYGRTKYEGFKVSKGWCDKFMRRNKVKLSGWTSMIDKFLLGDPYISDFGEEEWRKQLYLYGMPAEHLQNQIDVENSSSKNLAMDPDHIVVLPASDSPADKTTDYNLIMKEKICDGPVQEHINQIANMCNMLCINPIEFLDRKYANPVDTQVVEMLDRPRSLSEQFYGPIQDKLEKNMASSDILPEVNKNLIDEITRMGNGTSEVNGNANMIAFVSEVYLSIENLSRKFLDQGMLKFLTDGG